MKFDEAYGGETYAQSFTIVDEEDDYFESWLHDIEEEKVKEYSKSMKAFDEDNRLYLENAAIAEEEINKI